MYRLELSLDVYQRLKQNLAEIRPDIKLSLVSCDYALASLGFVDRPPCIINADLTKQEYESLLDELMEYEIDAYNQPIDERNIEKTPAYQKYVRYGWMWDVFYSAEYMDV